MMPNLLKWARDFATDQERLLAVRVSSRSGVPMLESAGQAVGHVRGTSA